ncbi:MAG: phosphoribosylformylglycinamidine synthase, partial [Lentisphaerae bacterium]
GQYDHEVKGLSVIKPYVGVMNDVPTDAAVMMVEQLANEGMVLSYGVCPRYSDIDTYHMAASAIDMAVRRIIAVGGDPDRIAGLDNFCWPDPVQSKQTPDGYYKLAQLVRANQALYDITTAYNVPCISGKDSMKNDSTRGGRKISIPPTLLFSALGRIEDISMAITLAPQRSGDLLYAVGTTRNELGGSEYYAMLGMTGNHVPTVEPELAMRIYRTLARAIRMRLCDSAHTPALGGIAAALVRKSIAGRVGIEVDLSRIPAESGLSAEQLLFSESNSRFLVTVAPRNREAFETLFADLPCALIGRTIREDQLKIMNGQQLLAELELENLINAFKSGLNYD